MIKKLIYFYEEYQKIIDSYRGEKTDWHEKYVRLEALAKDISHLEITYCKNFRFYGWVKQALTNEIWEELKRVSRLARD